MLLCDFDFEKRKKSYSKAEILLSVWIIALVLEELRQVKFSLNNSFSEANPKKKLLVCCR